MSRPLITPTQFNERGRSLLPGTLGIEVTHAQADRLEARLTVGERHMAPNGFLHGGTVVALADTCCGYATVNALPEGAVGFTTIELKTNYLGTALEGVVLCAATPVHLGRTTQVWDALVSHEDTGKTLATFRCTQMVLYPKA